MISPFPWVVVEMVEHVQLFAVVVVVVVVAWCLSGSSVAES